ncbi:RNA-binding domain-containing protein [Martensiomyces pterosporus]|nr:RNA-binding domain-containing protein [Martensiomyces pterosporus]
MTNGNPILPSEPLSLQPNLLAAAVIAEEIENQEAATSTAPAAAGQRNKDNGSPRNTSKVRRRLDRRHYGRSESRGYSGERRRSSSGAHNRDHSAVSLPRRLQENGGRPAKRAGQEYYGERERSYSPRFKDRNGARENGDSLDRRRDEGKAYGSGDRAENSHGTYYSSRRMSGGDAKDDPTPSRVLGIFGMSKFTSEQNLRDLFEQYGPVEKIQIIRDPYEGRSRGFAFVNMADVADAQRARDAITGTFLHDRKIRVDYSITNRPHSPTPGKYKGQDTFPGNSHHHHSRHHHQGYRSYNDGRNYRNGPPPQPYRYQGMGIDRPRRRANSRDRRRRDHPRPHEHRGARHWGRSKSPGYRGSSRPTYSSHHSQQYSDRGGSREYEESRGRGYSRSRSPAGQYGYDYGRSSSRSRHSRSEHRPEMTPAGRSAR